MLTLLHLMHCSYHPCRFARFLQIVEWSGFALAAWPSLPAAAFAFFTFCNLAPRGWRHHQWYQRRFPRYPKSRRAVIPFIW